MTDKNIFPDDWNEIISVLPGASLLQTSQWAEVKAKMGWEAFPKLWKKEDGKVEAAALILKRPIKIGAFSSGMSFLYVPRGPLMDWEKALRGAGTVLDSSARSTTDRVVSCPRQVVAQVSTKESTMLLPSWRVGREVFRLRAVSQSV